MPLPLAMHGLIHTYIIFLQTRQAKGETKIERAQNDCTLDLRPQPVQSSLSCHAYLYTIQSMYMQIIIGFREISLSMHAPAVDIRLFFCPHKEPG